MYVHPAGRQPPGRPGVSHVPVGHNHVRKPLTPGGYLIIIAVSTTDILSIRVGHSLAPPTIFTTSSLPSNRRMKLIVAGATGYVGSEVVRQALRRRDITSVVALARRPVEILDTVEGDVGKLKSVVIKDYDDYPEKVKKEFEGADGCIWTVAITPSKSRSLPFDEVKRVCQDCTMSGLDALYSAAAVDKREEPFRFIYMSGAVTSRDRSVTPRFMPEYSWMRGETETKVLEYAAAHKGMEACVAKPGYITGGDAMRTVMGTALRLTMSVPNVTLQQVSAAMLEQVTKGFERDTLENEDLVKAGQQVLA
ncbi:hypothetical protein QBC46DRAFT_394324 [Diplogelasinospora grovesii]|uniref:NAD(P)-binding domain-containing protein n=1 Tax=Diplogelasinospora grovesii TaxID=303347 RepID=A0AAN6S1N7_9PEZI|nr:hypothetical protein QBC46DRAFT_394324 [Diplogelasinospora grovesii]